MIKHSRAVVITIALALIGTFYSMSELNRISALHLSGANSDLRSSKPGRCSTGSLTRS
jgi:hypothetical protein